ncbi:MAG: tricarballylate utilization 4Fe-4S protein TcuB [Granulosicoccus sp.]
MQSSADHSEAVRQLGICNSFRYCEGYCGAFQALTRYREFDEPTVSHLANLCHNCRGCYYACQYTEPHEFALNIPALLANIRASNWEQHVKPQWLSRVMQKHIWPYVILTLIFVLLFTLVVAVPWASSEPFYASISHNVMVLVFAPLFIVPLASLALGVRSFWRSIGASTLALQDLKEALMSAATMRQLNGGQGQGCNYESDDLFTSWRRWAHQATMYGFLLCFASTSTATLYHYFLGLEAPYPLTSLPKLLGVSGGVLLSLGTAALAYLKSRANPELGSTARTASEYVFIVLLFLVSTTGLLLYGFSGTSLASASLIIHLSVVATFFIAIPYSKMAHGFFRLAALIREAQLKRTS